MKKYLVDVPVVLMVFIRPEKLKKTFEVIKRARPSILFLVSDGSREDYPQDWELIQQSRKAVEDIDWECEVHRLYSDKNIGMLSFGKKSLDYAFEHVDRLIFLEDDVVVSDTFFKYCEEMLEKYKDDLRINMVCGMNLLEMYDEPQADYFFSTSWSIWGFAMWKRTYDLFYNHEYKNDEYAYRRIAERVKHNKGFYNKLTQVDKNGIYSGDTLGVEYFLSLSLILKNQMNITPKRNMVTNIGYGKDSTHAKNELKSMPKTIRRQFNMKRYELKFPLRHPSYVVRDDYYNKEVNKILGRHNVLAKLMVKIDARYRRIVSKVQKVLSGRNLEE